MSKLQFAICLFAVICVASSRGRRLSKRQAPQQQSPILLAAAPPPPPIAQPLPQTPQDPIVQQQFQPPLTGVQNPFALQQPDQGASLLQVQQQPLVQPVLASKRNFAPGFESKPIPTDLNLNQPKVQWIGDEPRVDPVVLQQQLLQLQLQQQQLQLQQQQLLPVIRTQEQQPGKNDQFKFQAFPQPPPTPQQQQQQQQLLANSNISPEQQELRQRIQQAIASQNKAGRDREAFLARINVTGDQTAAQEFVRQLRNLSDYLDQQPFVTLDVMTSLINSEIQLLVDNWIINEELAGQLAASFSIPRESVGTAFVLTPADIDEMHVAGNNPTAAKTFHVQLKELLWVKTDQQYRITTDLLASLSDHLLQLLVGNGVVKEKFGDDIATYFYRSNNRKIKLF